MGRGHSRSLKMAPFDRSHTRSSCIVTMAVFWYHFRHK